MVGATFSLSTQSNLFSSFRNMIGKNASDSALIIDAMDLLHTRQLGGFCLVSSDSDFYSPCHSDSGGWQASAERLFSPENTLGEGTPCADCSESPQLCLF